VANATAAIWVAGNVDSLREGVLVAQQAIDSGSARELLDRLVQVTNSK
jgi:anthranilate phosphoribosyltransferase